MFHMSKASVEHDAADLVSGSDPSTQDGSSAPATVARLVTDRGHAQRLADLLAEQFEAAAVAIYEQGPHWCVDIHFADPPNIADARARLAALVGDETAQAFRFETIAARDWVAGEPCRPDAGRSRTFRGLWRPRSGPHPGQSHRN